MNYIADFHEGHLSGNIYSNIKCPGCGNSMKIMEAINKYTNEFVILNFCGRCRIQVPEQEGQRHSQDHSSTGEQGGEL